jgi:ATP-dependent DNA ligase
LALYAEGQGAEGIAQGFWEKAFELTFGSTPTEEERLPLIKSGSGREIKTCAQPEATQASAETARIFPGLPDHLQPGKIVTMQPVDAPKEVECYLRDPVFLAQPKRDGERFVVVVGEDGTVWAQTRSGRMVPVSAEWLTPLRNAAECFGAFILDGERYYADADGKEHRTGAQAATANINRGKPDGKVVERYAVFKALFFKGRDLTGNIELVRIQHGAEIGWTLAGMDCESFEVLRTADTPETKTALMERQKSEGREGIVLVNLGCKYTGGKAKGDAAPFVRHKFLRTLDVVVTGLTQTTAAGRSFGAIEVSAFSNGQRVKLGSVGTGFTQDEARELAALHQANPGGVVIEIATQGFTESGQVWHARYLGIRPDKEPTECKVAM